MTMSALVHDSLSPNARRDGATCWASWMRVFAGGRGVRAGWQEWRKTPARLQRSTARVLGSRWRSRTGHADRTGIRRPASASRTQYALAAHVARRARALEAHGFFRRFD